MWRHALIFPDAVEGWAWATRSLVGLPTLVRVLMTLRRAGIRDVMFPPGAEVLRPWLTSCQESAGFPTLSWSDQSGWSGLSAGASVLGVRGGVLFTPQLLHWFHEVLDGTAVGKAALPARDTLPVLVAFTSEETSGQALQLLTLEHLAARITAPASPIPPDLFCQTVQELASPGKERALLSTVGKPTDRGHVEWVRRWTFPALRWLARSRVRPNHITWAGFLVVLVACFLIAQGQYWHGVGGALLLYASWVLDCMDGTLARLTFTESPLGQKLDTVLGHVSNLCIFGALIWAVYGAGPVWKTVGMACFILGGIVVAQRVLAAEKRLRMRHGTSHHGRLYGFLAKINHRDYAVLILFLAVVQGFHIFLWLSLVGVQIYWLLQLWLMRKHLHTTLRLLA